METKVYYTDEQKNVWLGVNPRGSYIDFFNEEKNEWVKCCICGKYDSLSNPNKFKTSYVTRKNNFKQRKIFYKINTSRFQIAES